MNASDQDAFAIKRGAKFQNGPKYCYWLNKKMGQSLEADTLIAGKSKRLMTYRRHNWLNLEFDQL